MYHFEWKVRIPERVLEAKYFGNLKQEVIDAEICSHCGTCACICPARGITVGDQQIDFPKWEDLCVDCGACIKVCPRWKYKPLNGVGEFLEMHSARSNRLVGQDGGMVTEIMATALELGIIDRAVFVSKDEKMKPEMFHVRSRDQLKIEKLRGTKYSFADVLPELRKAISATKKGVGVVGTPCMISGIRKLQNNIPEYSEKVKLVVGLFCTENFYHWQLYDFLKNNKDADMREVLKTNIAKGNFIVSLKDGREVIFSVKEFDPIIPSGCKVCQDFASIESDVSVGSVGSKDGYSSVIIRKEVAKKIMDYIIEKKYATFGKLMPELLTKLANFKIKIHPYPKKKKKK